MLSSSELELNSSFGIYQFFFSNNKKCKNCVYNIYDIKVLYYYDIYIYIYSHCLLLHSLSDLTHLH